jgi:hypothetical protein
LAVAGRLPDVDVRPDGKVARREDGALVIDAATATEEVVALISRTDANEQESVFLLPQLDGLHP